MTEFITNIRPYLEAIGFLASIVLAGGVLIAWRQLRHIRQDSKTRILREAQLQAIHACDDYLRNACEHPFFKDDYPARVGHIGDFTRKSLSKKEESDLAAYFNDHDLFRSFLNHLDSISAKFISGVADEDIGFRSFGLSFCNTVEMAYGVIAFPRGREGSNYWSNIVELYQLWRPKLETLELEHARQQLEKRRREIKIASPKRPTGL